MFIQSNIELDLLIEEPIIFFDVPQNSSIMPEIMK